jgi:hypothetical protein
MRVLVMWEPFCPQHGFLRGHQQRRCAQSGGRLRENRRDRSPGPAVPGARCNSAGSICQSLVSSRLARKTGMGQNVVSIASNTWPASWAAPARSRFIWNNHWLRSQ